MDKQRVRETFSVGKTADERNSTAVMNSGIRGYDIQHRRRVELTVCLIFISIIAGMVFYICFRLQAEQLHPDCKGTSPKSKHVPASKATEIVTPTTQSPKILTPKGGHEHSATIPMAQISYEDCGGIVHVPRNSTVYIAYKNGSEYANNERCLWVISSEANQVILKFGYQNLDKSISYRQDGFTVAQMDTYGQELKCTKWTRDDYTKVKYLSVPSFLHFTSHNQYFTVGNMHRHGFVLSLTAVEKGVDSLNQWIRPSFSFVRSRKRGVLNLLDFGTGNFSTTPYFTGPAHHSNQNPFGVFFTSPSHGISKRNFTCVGSLEGNVTEHSCCNFVDGYEIKKYHDGESCVHAAGFVDGSRSVVTEDSFVVFNPPQSGVKNTPCQLKWTE